MKTSELIGPALDWAVAKCEGLNPRFFTEHEAYEADVLHQTLKFGDYIIVLRPNNHLTPLAKYRGYNDGVCWKDNYYPSTDWSQGGPIIEREKISVIDKAFLAGTIHGKDGTWMAYSHDSTLAQSVFGFTPLVAAMRRYVDSKLGDEVEIPDELKV